MDIDVLKVTSKEGIGPGDVNPSNCIAISYVVSVRVRFGTAWSASCSEPLVLRLSLLLVREPTARRR